MKKKISKKRQEEIEFIKDAVFFILFLVMMYLSLVVGFGMF